MGQWPHVKEIFHAALEREPLERAAFLAEVCQGDEALRVEVERLLAAHAEAADFIEPPATADDHPRFAGDGTRSALSGLVAGRYEIGRLLGAGGMGEVYAARDVELRRDVAVKVAAGGDAEADAQLRREAQHAAQLNHPHICTIHEVGAYDGQPFIVMEYVAGQRLSDLIPQDGLPVELVLRYGAQIAEGVAHAHRHGVLHRDLKSPNIIVTPEDRAKILDFGLARRLSERNIQLLSESKASMASEAGIAGTLSCMAPELLRGEPATERSDIWAVGVLLYEMACGRRPFEGATGFELSGAILHQAPAPLPARVPVSFQDIVQRCLAKTPSDRYARADEVQTALETVRVIPNARGISRRRVAVMVAGLVAVLGLASGWHWLRPSVSPSVAVGASGRPAIAVMTFENVGAGQDKDSAWLSTGVPSMLLTGLAQTRGLEIVSVQRLHDALKESGAQSLESLDRGQIPEVARRAGAGAVVVGSIFRAGSEIRIDAQLEDLASGRVLTAESVRGTDVFALVDQLSARIRQGLGVVSDIKIRPVADVSSTSLEAYRLYSLGIEAGANMRGADARKLLEQAVALDPAFADAYLELAFNDGSYSFVHKEYLIAAQEHADRLTERNRLLLQAAIAIEAGKYIDAGRILDDLIARFPDVERAYSVAYVLYRPGTGSLPNAEKFLAVAQAGARTLPFSPRARNNYGYALLMAGRYPEAVREFQAYARIAPREPNPFDSLGDAYFTMGDADRALESYNRALAIDPTYGSRDSRARVLATLGRYDEAVLEEPVRSPFVRAQILSRVGRYREAEQVVAEGLKQETADTFGRIAGLYLTSAMFAIEQTDYPRALQECREAEKPLTRMRDEGRRTAAGVLVALLSGIAESRGGRRDQALAQLAIQKRSYQPADPSQNSWYNALDGEIALAAGDLDRAARAFSAAEPPGTRRVALATIQPPVVPGNLLVRDGAARVARARGDLQGAIQIYRRLLVFEPDQLWVPVFEPRHVLEIARLLEQLGDKQAARKEYARFLEFWKRADASLPELAEARLALVRTQ